MLFMFVLFTAGVAIVFAEECYDDGNEFCIDQEDILSVDLLPGSFLLMDQKENGNNGTFREKKADGTIDGAFNEMGFHRKMMNQYLCHGFMAEQILTEVGPPRVKRRLDESPSSSLLDFMNENNITIQDKLLSDEGSSKYKDWLKRTTTLDDIYRHYAPRKKSRMKQILPRFDNDGYEEYDGEVTGYAMPAPPLPSGKIGGYYDTSGSDHIVASPTGHNSNYGEFYGHHGEFFPQVHEEHYYSGPSHNYDEHDEHYEHNGYHKPSHHHGKGKGHHQLSLRDFFEIALTALAFLSFGVFLLQLLMNVKNAATATAASIIADIDGTRFKRDAPYFASFTNSGNQQLNELSHRVLRSIEAALIAEQDGGNCLRRILCEDNRLSREANGIPKIWVPVWSLGMSWVSGRVLKRTRWSAMLDSVKASILGLGGADCVALYPDCNLEEESTRRRRRRRK